MMVEVIVFAEGPTEEQFIKRLVAPALRSLQVFVKPRMLNTSRHATGGAINFDRLKFSARNTLRQEPNVVLTTLLDLYGLDTTFPGFETAGAKPDMNSRVEYLEASLTKALVAHVGCRPERFIAHIQPYEYEGLLFADPQALVQTEPGWQTKLSQLIEIRKAYPTPEHINDSYETKPSRRLEELLQPRYKKTRHGPLAAEHITLPVMEKECPHFRGWMDSLRKLGGGV